MTKRKQGKTRRHHYIPVFYLRGFLTSDGSNRLWVYDKEDRKVFSSTPRRIAFQRNFHTFTDGDLKQDTESVEKFYWSIERAAASVILKIQDGEQLDEEAAINFSYFVASLMSRVPNYRNNIEKVFIHDVVSRQKMLAANREAFEANYESFVQATGASRDISAEDIRQSILEDEFEFTANPIVGLSYALKSVHHLASIFHQMNWVFAKAMGNEKYLTGDNPVFYLDPTRIGRGTGLLHKNVEVTLPLSKDIAAIAGWTSQGDYQILKADKRFVRELNSRTISASLRYVYSSKKSMLLQTSVFRARKSAPTIRIS